MEHSGSGKRIRLRLITIPVAIESKLQPLVFWVLIAMVVISTHGNSLNQPLGSTYMQQEAPASISPNEP